jgi:hypothetical protein
MQTSSDTSTCTSALGRNCQANVLYSSGSALRLDKSALSALASRAYELPFMQRCVTIVHIHRVHREGLYTNDW